MLQATTAAAARPELPALRASHLTETAVETLLHQAVVLLHQALLWPSIGTRKRFKAPKTAAPTLSGDCTPHSQSVRLQDIQLACSCGTLVLDVASRKHGLTQWPRK